MNTLAQIFLTETGFISPRWQRVFRQAQVVTDLAAVRGALTYPARDSMVWVLTGTPQWQAQIQWLSHRGAHVIAMTRLAGLEETKQALEAGARGYVDALASPAQLLQASSSVSAGALWLPQNLLNGIIGVVSRSLSQSTPGQEGDLSLLTQREREVVLAVTDGRSNKAVAAQLNITERTIKEHLGKAYSKLGVRDRMQLMLYVRGQKHSEGAGSAQQNHL